MQILGLLGIYFDAVVIFFTSQTLLFRLALAILWIVDYWTKFRNPYIVLGSFGC